MAWCSVALVQDRIRELDTCDLDPIDESGSFHQCGRPCVIECHVRYLLEGDKFCDDDDACRAVSACSICSDIEGSASGAARAVIPASGASHRRISRVCCNATTTEK